MVKISVFLMGRSDLTHEQFIQYWKDKHASLLMSLDSFKSSVRRYTQQHSLKNVPGDLPIVPYDGVAEVWFDDLSSAMALFGHQDYTTIIVKDEENFLDRTKTTLFISSETKIV
jgi:uncharacterized protein (TIGR02118 family)